MILRAAAICVILTVNCAIASAAEVPPGESRRPNADAAPGAPSSPSGQSPRNSTASPPTPTRASFSDQYGVLAERNIFLRDRTVRRPGNDRPSTTQPARPIEESFVVRGIVLEDGAFRAYIEDTARSATTRVTAGDALARGTVTRIEIDGIEYDANDKQTWVTNGNDLTGRNALASSLGFSPATPTTGPTSLPFDPNDPSLSIEQRMRLRRSQGR